MRIYPIFLEATGYYDWLYGLQRLFREGRKAAGRGRRRWSQQLSLEQRTPGLFSIDAL